MADVEITNEEVRGIDINQVASMQLKDGTVVVVNPENVEQEQEQGQEQEQEQENVEGEYQNEGEFAQEEIAQDQNANEYVEDEDQSNQLRARPVLVTPVRPAVVPVRPAVVPVRPAVVPMRPPVVPMRPAVVPMRPAVVPIKPVPRGPVRPGAPVVFRARPGMARPIKPAVVPMRPPVPVVPMRPPVPVVPLRPTVPMRPPVPVAPMRPVPIAKPVVPVVPVKPVARPVVPGPKPLLNQMIQAPLRARPEAKEEEFQEEEYAGEEQYCECDEQAQEECTDNQLRARPLVVPMRPPMRPPVMVPPVMRPVPVKPIMAPRRGPAVYNTYQPRVFRARPRPMARVVPVPMFTPLNTTFQPVVHGRRHHMPPPPRPGFAPVFRSKPGETQNNEEYAEEEYACEGTECNKTCVCSKCGKEF